MKLKNDEALSDTPISDKADENHNLDNSCNLLSSKCILPSKNSSKEGINQENPSEVNTLALCENPQKHDLEVLGILEDFEQINNASKNGFYKVAKEKTKKALRYASYAFLIRAMVAYEFCLDKRLPGGRDKRDESGIGRLAALRLVADWFGIENVSTIQDDVKIIVTFYINQLSETDRSIRLVLISALQKYPRGYFRAAAYCEDPILAINHAAFQIETGPYSIAQFKKDIAQKGIGSKRSNVTKKVDEEIDERTEFCELFLSKTEFNFLKVIAQMNKCKIDATVGIIIRNYFILVVIISLITRELEVNDVK